LLAIPHIVLLVLQLQNYINPHNTIEKGDVQGTPSKGRISEIIRPYHSTPKRVRMTTNHLALSKTRLVTFKSTMFMLGLRNRALPNTTSFKNSGTLIHGGLVL
jgi:hypothetical protein